VAGVIGLMEDENAGFRVHTADVGVESA